MTSVPPTSMRPTVCPLFAVALADVHASWWEAGRLTDAGHPLHDAPHIQQLIDIAAPGVRTYSMPAPPTYPPTGPP